MWREGPERSHGFSRKWAAWAENGPFGLEMGTSTTTWFQNGKLRKQAVHILLQMWLEHKIIMSALNATNSTDMFPCDYRYSVVLFFQAESERWRGRLTTNIDYSLANTV